MTLPSRIHRLRVAVLAALALIAASAHAFDVRTLEAAAAREESTLQARVGVAVIDTASGQAWHHRGEERFPLTSTYKAFACAAVLARSDERKLDLGLAVPIDRTALVAYSPVTGKVPDGGTLSVRDLCKAAVSVSDNTAANLALDAIGGAPTATAFMRSIGDPQTRLDRREPDLNQATPGDPRDTTTPMSAARSLRSLLLGDVLSAPSREQLTQWMLDDQVAHDLLRAGLPENWRIADKSGAGGHGSRSIIAIAWPPARSPVVLAVYITQTQAPMKASDQAVARIGAAVAKALQ